METAMMDIPRNLALRLCAEIRHQYQGNWWILAELQCMGCTAVTKVTIASVVRVMCRGIAAATWSMHV